jgi:flagellar basal-body rod protein FlgG
MSRGIFVALSGAILKQDQIEMISQNLANSNSLAYKKMTSAFKDYLTDPENEREGKIMTELAAMATDHSPGGLTLTGNPLDLALEGSGFFALEDNRFTRRGDLKRNEKGYLTTQSGIRLQGLNGPIQISEGKLEIGPGGEVMVNDSQVATIKLVDFPDKSTLTRLGQDLFQTAQAGSPARAVIKQGHLESSNVNVVREMTQILTTLREFQAFQKVIQGFDETTAKMTEIARV